MTVQLVGDDAQLSRRMPEPCQPYDEFVFTLILSRLRQGTGTPWAPRKAFFQHEKDRRGDDELRRILGCPVVYGAESSGIVVPADVLPLRQDGDSRLLDILERYANTLLSALPPRSEQRQQHSASHARASIARQLQHGTPTLSATAKALHAPPRTLQRQLAAEGHTYASLVDDVRRELAVKYLDAGLSLTEVAFLLHFSDVSAFHRAFKRWTRTTPGRYQKHAT